MATAVIDSKLFTAEVIEEIQRILKHGNGKGKAHCRTQGSIPCYRL